jgi:hypothetical protein
LSLKCRTYSRLVSYVVFFLLINGALFVALPSLVMADTSGDYEYMLINGDTEIEITGYLGAGGSIEIPDLIDEKPVTAIGSNAFEGNTNLTDVTISSNVTIGIGAFSFCTSLTNVTILDGVTDIGSGAFYGSTSLTNVTIPESVTSIGSGAFAYCNNLTNVTIPINVTSIGDWAFYGCSSLTAINVDPSNLNYASVDGVLYNKTITNLIQYPGGMAGTFIIPTGVTTIGNNAFSECTSLTNVTIPESVTSIGSEAFSGCTTLTSIYFEGDAPSCADTWINDHSAELIIYYHSGAVGFTDPWEGVPTATY